jgi:chemotaxis protein CheX
MTDALSLPARLDTPAARSLADMLGERASAKAALLLDGQNVEQIGLACLQVLAGARKTAATLGLDFRITEPSEALVEGVDLAGLTDLLAA